MIASRFRPLMLAVLSLAVVTVAAAASAPTGQVHAAGGADLAISQTMVGLPQSGSTVTFVLTVTNNGPDPMANFRVDDIVPAGSRLDGPARGPGICDTARTTNAFCFFSGLAVGASITMTVPVQLGDPGNTTNRAVIAFNALDPNISNNSSLLNFTITPGTTDLQVTGSASTGSPAANSSLVYTFQVKNSGPRPAENVSFTDVLPAGVTFIQATPVAPGTSCAEAAGVVSCSLGNLAVGGQVNVIVQVMTPATPGPLSTTAAVGANNPDAKPANNSVTVNVTVR